jgi:guanosine-3',5'-bis(diphosphate) 3'-pyrophosphohydrolase
VTGRVCGYDCLMTHASLWQLAASYSARIHQHQFRKDGETPYGSHPARVAMIIALEFGFTDERILAAAFLHDAIEDSDTDYEDIAEPFGEDVADYVVVMTKDMRMPEAEREVAYDAQLAAGPWQARLIKLADVYDNLSDARTDWGRRKIIEKAERALGLAAGDDQLADACAKLRELIERVEAGLREGVS